MFGHKEEAEAVVITQEKVHESPIEHGSNFGGWHYETWRFVLEVRPQGSAAYRVGAEQKIRIPGFSVPDVGNAVRVQFEEKHPDKIEIVLEGDDRYDDGLRDREDKEREKAGKAGRDAAFQTALDAPPGSPPAGGRPGAGGGDSQDA